MKPSEQYYVYSVLLGRYWLDEQGERQRISRTRKESLEQTGKPLRFERVVTTNDGRELTTYRGGTNPND